MADRRTRSKTERRRARVMYEQGETLSYIAEQIGVTPKTVSNWKKQDGWQRADEAPKPPTPVADIATSDDTGTTDSNYLPTVTSDYIGATEAATSNASVEDVIDSEAELRARIAELEAELEQKDEQIDEMRPTKDVNEWFADRVQWLTDNSPEGEKYWVNRAEAKFAADNVKRAKEGLPPFDIKHHPEILDDLINELKTKERMDAAKEPDEPPARKVKMFIMRNGMPTIEQIPMENQINNMKGSLGDGILRYTRKGFKLTEPFLCPRAGCFRPASTDEFGRWTADGYCSDTHRREVEGDAVSAVSGFQVQTKDPMIRV